MRTAFAVSPTGQFFLICAEESFLRSSAQRTEPISRRRLALAIALVASGCITDFQVRPEATSGNDSNWQPAGCFRSSRLTNPGQSPRAIKCLPTNSVVKRKDERRESVAATSQFRRMFLQNNSFSSIIEGFALSTARPERLFELSGTPPPSFCC